VRLTRRPPSDVEDVPLPAFGLEAHPSSLEEGLEGEGVLEGDLPQGRNVGRLGEQRSGEGQGLAALIMSGGSDAGKLLGLQLLDALASSAQLAEEQVGGGEHCQCPG